jgi:hypothetical protein
MSELDVCGLWGTCLRRTQDLRERLRWTEATPPGHVVASLLALAVAFVAPACDREKAPRPTEVVASALNASPKLGVFVLEAQPSIRLQTGGLVVNGGDIGARGTGSGPFLSGGVAIDAFTGVQVQSTHNLIADSVRLGTGVTVGDIQTNRFVNGVGTTHGPFRGWCPCRPYPRRAALHLVPPTSRWEPAQR